MSVDTFSIAFLFLAYTAYRVLLREQQSLRAKLLPLLRRAR